MVYIPPELTALVKKKIREFEMAKKVKVIQPAETEKSVPLEVLAESIRDLAKFGREINASKINRKGILILLSASTGLPKKVIGDILDAVPQLEKQYLK